MDAAQLDRLVRESISAEPDPPRPVPRWVLLEHSLLNGPALAVIAVGAGTLWAVSSLSGAAELVGGPGSQPTAFTVVLTALGVGLIGLPLVTYARLAHVLRHGVRTVARVTELDAPDTPAKAQAGPADAEQGRAGTRRRVTGHRLVEHPVSLFEEPFSSDAEWAEALMPGSEIDVVVHPRRPRVLLELGLA